MTKRDGDKKNVHNLSVKKDRNRVILQDKNNSSMKIKTRKKIKRISYHKVDTLKYT